MKRRLVTIILGTLATGALAVGASIFGGGGSAQAAPTVDDYLTCSKKKDHAGPVTEPIRNTMKNNSSEAHTICGVYLLTGL